MDLKEARKRAGLTQKDLAEKSGISNITISKIETNYVLAHFKTQKAIEKILGPTIDWDSNFRSYGYPNYFIVRRVGHTFYFDYIFQTIFDAKKFYKEHLKKGKNKEEPCGEEYFIVDRKKWEQAAFFNLTKKEKYKRKG